ncbi:hypothetical protein Poli38472_012990 [Pythium oligandrum]|uniref:RPA-interacting protein C-terminal domain-containing protein n=1 Tax=Pythium oligandrum TaxID=41045 RepID=A0A8K1CK08_PYTOL|nr:hypothetical protein Poli38472_012990 [Pythium oligandrum]|eukprot:TMW64368.1 hypothetical protein Poli38472_012990 [Pythium oligandrum]
MEMEKKPRTAVTKSAAFHACLSPPLWKDQLRARCMERVKQNRQQLLAKLRSPDANVVDEMKRLVYREERRQDKHSKRSSSSSTRRARHPVFDLQRETQDAEEDDVLVTIEELMMTGELSEQDYLDIVTSLEDELRQENDEEDREDERLAQEMMEFEEASLAAMLSGMDLDGVPDFGETQNAMDETASSEALAGNGIHVLCPVCKADSLRETSAHSISCSCGFDFCVKNVYHGALLDFQDMITCAFMDHREHCSVDPSFEAIPDFFGEAESDSLLMYCRACRHEVLF